MAYTYFRDIVTNYCVNHEVHSRSPLIRVPIIRIGLAFRLNLSRILQNELVLKLPVTA